MHSDLHIPDDLDLPQLEALRTRLELTQAELCRKLMISPSTYQRWRKYLKGEVGGVCPQPRSLTALREALLREAARRAAAEASDLGQTRPAA